MIHAKLEEDRRCYKFSRLSDGAEVYFTDKTEKLLEGKSPAPLRDWDYVVLLGFLAFFFRHRMQRLPVVTGTIEVFYARLRDLKA